MLKANVAAGNFTGVLHCQQLHRCSSLPTTPIEQGERGAQEGWGERQAHGDSRR
jgi:hypothetical protein